MFILQYRRKTNIVLSIFSTITHPYFICGFFLSCHCHSVALWKLLSWKCVNIAVIKALCDFNVSSDCVLSGVFSVGYQCDGSADGFLLHGARLGSGCGDVQTPEESHRWDLAQILLLPGLHDHLPVFHMHRDSTGCLCRCVSVLAFLNILLI